MTTKKVQRRVQRMSPVQNRRAAEKLHSFASHLVMRGAPLKAVQELMGHSTIEMPMRYSHLSPDARREGVKLLDLKEAVTMVWKTSKGAVLRFPLGSGARLPPASWRPRISWRWLTLL